MISKILAAALVVATGVLAGRIVETPNHPIDGWNYVGCRKVDPGCFDIVGAFTDQYTQEQCQTECKIFGYTVAALFSTFVPERAPSPDW